MKPKRTMLAAATIAVALTTGMTVALASRGRSPARP